MSRLLIVTYLISFAFLNLLEVLAQRPLELVLQTLSSGNYQALVQEEEKSIKVDAQTTRIIRTTSNFNHENERQIIEVVEEEHRKLPSGEEHVSRTVSTPDINGRFSVIRREVQTTIVTDLGVQETNTTVFKPDINGGFRPVEQIEQTEKEKGPGTVETERISKVRDGSGNWVPYERRTATIREANGQSRREEEQIYRKDYSTGGLTLSERVDRTYSRASEESEQWIIDTHIKNIGGDTRYGDVRFHLARRVRIVWESLPGGRERTVQEVEERNPVAPNQGLRVIERTETTSRPTGNGENELEIEVKALGGNEELRTVLTRKTRISGQ